MAIKTHPLMLFTFLKPYSFVLILPLARAFLKFGFEIILNGAFFFESAVFSVLLLLTFLKWRFYRFYKNSDGFLLCYGIFVKREIYVPFARVSSVYERQNLIERVFSAKTVIISTDAKGKIAQIKVCIKENESSKVLLDDFLSCRSKPEKYSPLKIVLWAALSGGGFSGALILVPTVNRTAELLGIGLYELFVEKIAANTEILGSYMPRALNVVTFVLICFYLLTFVYRLFKGFDFTVSIEKEKTEISNGIIVKHRTRFKEAATRGFITEQPLLMRLTGFFTAWLSVGGCDIERLVGNSLIVPISAKKRENLQISKLYLQTAILEQISKISAKKGLFSAIMPSLLVAITIFFGAAYLFWSFKNFRRLTVFLGILALLVVLWWADLLIYSYKRGGLFFGEKITAIGTRGLKRRTIYSTPDNIGLIKITESPFDKKRGSCKVTFTLFSNKAERVRVKWLKTEEMLNLLKTNKLRKK